MNRMSGQNRRRAFALVLLLAALISTMWDAPSNAMPHRQDENAAFSVDYSLTMLEKELQQDISEFLAQNAGQLVTKEKRFTVTVQYSDADNKQHLRLVPTELYRSNWSIAVLESDIVSLVMFKTDEGRWEIALDANYVITKTPEGINSSYSFPWTGGQSWLKTQGFHYSNLGYSLDFKPGSGASNNVLAIESGTFSAYCYIPSDPYQAMVKVTHESGDTSGYLHVDKGSVPSGLFSHAVPKGQVLGSLYTGSAIYLPHPACTDLQNYKFATACGCGYGTHLHFETNDLITIQGYPLQSISDAVNGTSYTSNNSSGCCGCSTQAVSRTNGVTTARSCSTSSTATTSGRFSFRSLPAVSQPITAAAPSNTTAAPAASSRESAQLADLPAALPPPMEELAEPTVACAPVDPLCVPPVSASYAIRKSVFGSGGGPKISTSYRLQGTSGQTTGTSALISASYRLHSGYWGKPSCPLAEMTAAPAIGVDGANVTLTWDVVPGATLYRIYRDDEPYFAPATPHDSTTNTSWTDSSGGGDPLHNYTYVVRAVNACGESAILYRVGEFDFTLAPGE